jgi:hypothetical protein
MLSRSAIVRSGTACSRTLRGGVVTDSLCMDGSGAFDRRGNGKQSAHIYSACLGPVLIKAAALLDIPSDATNNGPNMLDLMCRRPSIGNEHPCLRGRQRRAFALGNIGFERLAADSVFTLLQYCIATTEGRASFSRLGSAYGINELNPAWIRSPHRLGGHRSHTGRNGKGTDGRGS